MLRYHSQTTTTCCRDNIKFSLAVAIHDNIPLMPKQCLKIILVIYLVQKISQFHSAYIERYLYFKIGPGLAIFIV